MSPGPSPLTTPEPAQPRAEPRRVLLLANDHARQTRQRLPEAVDRLAAAGFELLPKARHTRREFRELIDEHRRDVDFIVVAGGDGTLNRAVDSLVEAGFPLGIIPLGTANDLARTLGIPADLDAACRVIADGHLRRIDLGWVNGKHYFNVASLGLSVMITRQLNPEVKKRWGVLAYLITASRVTSRYRPFRAEICSGDEVIPVRTLQIAVGNGRFYGGGMTVAEDAAIDDQRLDLYSLEVRHWWRLLRLLPKLRAGRLAEPAEIRTLTGREFEIRTRRRRAINTDGEITAWTPATFRVIPRALSVFVPKPGTAPGAGKP